MVTAQDDRYGDGRGSAGSTDQVVSDVRTRIESGALRPGDRLPAEHELAVHIGVSRPTVRAVARTSFRDLKDAARMHERIFDAIRERHAETARALMSAHLIQASQYQAQEPETRASHRRARHAPGVGPGSPRGRVSGSPRGEAPR
jgi:DNA-binding FadR family transcriptional regulator